MARCSCCACPIAGFPLLAFIVIDIQSADKRRRFRGQEPTRYAQSSSSVRDPERTSLALCLRPHCFCGIGVLPVGPIAVTCKITSPSFAHP
jgi:hypothetical protein